MEFSDDEVLNFIEERLITNRTADESLSNIERTLLISAWRYPRLTYREIAEAERYSQSYVHNVASQLWDELSTVFQTKIRKTNLKSTISSIMLRQRRAPDVATDVATDQPARHDFGNWVGEIQLLGRDRELQQLTEYLISNQARIVGIIGITGIGKSCLCEAVVRRLANQFPVILCRSLRSHISFRDILNRLINLIEPENSLATASLDDMLQTALQLMQQRQCLLILEDFDAIAQDGHTAQQEAELYQQFLQRVSHLRTSCVLVISRFNTAILNLAFWQQAQSLFLSALSPQASQQLMARHGDLPPVSLLHEIQTYYAHHPRYLTAVAQQVHQTIAGSWPYFWESLSSRLLQSIHHCLEADYNHLNPVEQDVMHWLIVAAKPLPIDYLQSHLPRSAAQTDLIHIVSKLRDRAFIQIVNSTTQETNSVPFYVPSAIWQDFILQRLLNQLVEELYTGHFELLHQLPMRSAQDPAAVIQQQIDQLTMPVLHRLQELYGSIHQLRQRLKTLLEQVCARQLEARSYTVGNLINLCQAAAVSFDALDFSDLDIRNADFCQVSLWNCTGCYTRLRNCGFAIPLAGSVKLALDGIGQHLAIGESSGQITIWQVETATPIRRFNDAEIHSLAFHPQQPILACGTALGFVCLWHWQSQSDPTIIVRKIHDAPITALSFSADGEMLAIGDRNGRTFLWFAPFQANSTLQELPMLVADQLSDRQAAIRHLTWSDDGQRLASSDSYTALVWERSTNTTTQISDPNIDRIRSLIFEDNNLYAAVSDRTSLRLWSLEPTLLLATVEPEATITHAYLWRTQTSSPTLYLVYIKDDQLIFKTVNSELDEIANAAVELNTPLTVSGDGQRLAAMPNAHSIHLWQMPSASVPTASVVQRWQGYSCPVQSYAFNPTAKLFAVGNRDGSVRVWDLDTLRCCHVFQASHTRICAIAISPDSQYLASSDMNGRLWLWSLASDQPAQSLEGHRHEIEALAFHPSQPQLASGSTSGTIRLWHTSRGTTQHTFCHRVGITHLIFSADGKHLISGDRQGLICVWDLDQHQLLTDIQAHNSAIEYLGFTPSGRLISAGRDHTVRLWDSTYQAATVLFENANFYISHVSCIDEQHYWIAGRQTHPNHQDKQAQIISIDLSNHVPINSRAQQSATKLITLLFLHSDAHLFFTPHQGIASLQLGDRFQLWERLNPQSASLHTQPDIDLLLNSPYHGFRLSHPEGLNSVQIELLKRLGVSIDG